MDKRPFNKLTPVPFEQVEINDHFWSQRQKINREVAIHFQHQKLEEYRHIDNFRVAAGIKKGIHRGIFFFDSDLYKWLEAACYFLRSHKDPELEKKIDEIVDLIVKAQTKDGYINTYYISLFPNKRFTNIYIFHELYCAGHLFEAAIAHYKTTGSKKLSNVAEKFTDLLIKIFIKKKMKGVPGHQEIELALIGLYRITKDEKYLNLAKEFIDRRGNTSNYKFMVIKSFFNNRIVKSKENKITREYEKSQKDFYNPEEHSPKMKLKYLIKGIFKIVQENLNGKYSQANVPVRKATEPVGHAVKAVYLYSAMADLYSEIGDESLLNALEIIWLKMIKARMYITGGIGSIPVLEGFGRDFELSNEGSYSEICASVGNVNWNWRMLQINSKSKYSDLIEKLIYNAFLVGQSIDGKQFTYNNPLTSRGKDERREWFYCACCPPNVARTIASIGKYIYSTSERGLWIHQYIGNNAELKWNDSFISISMESQFPWAGSVNIKVGTESNLNMSIFLRIPSWTHDTKIYINQKEYQSPIKPKTYVEINKDWQNGDTIEILFKMEPHIESADYRFKKLRNHGVIVYGPLIYCLEQIDNDFNILKEKISKNPDITAVYESDLLNGIVSLEGKMASGKKFKAIPYYSWCNRGPNKMQVWNKIEN